MLDLSIDAFCLRFLKTSYKFFQILYYAFYIPYLLILFDGIYITWLYYQQQIWHLIAREINFQWFVLIQHKLARWNTQWEVMIYWTCGFRHMEINRTIFLHVAAALPFIWGANEPWVPGLLVPWNMSMWTMTYWSGISTSNPVHDFITVALRHPGKVHFITLHVLNHWRERAV